MTLHTPKCAQNTASLRNILVQLISPTSLFLLVAFVAALSLQPAAFALPTADAPVISLPSGNYTGTQSVSMTDDIPGATILYTLTGKAPNGSSTQYTGPVSISVSMTVEAIATAPGYSSSVITSAVYTFPATAPSLSLAPGTYSGPQTLTMSSPTPNAKIYYTTNGNSPSQTSTLYAAPITVSSSETVQAATYATSYTASSIVSAAYSIVSGTATPVISPGSGTYGTAQSITIADSTSGAVIYYTTNGGTPTSSSAVYSGPIPVSTTTPVQAMAIAPGQSASSVAQASYTITLAAATPVISPGGGTYTSAQSVTISDSTSGAVIYYTTNGSAPTTSSAVYSGPIQVSMTTAMQAIAVAPGGTASPASQASFTITAPATATPAISPGSGTYGAAQSVTIADSTPGAVIYYTANGSIPTTSSSVYSGPIPVSSTTAVEAIAIAPGDTVSSVAQAGYTITLATAAPGISPGGGVYTTTQSVTISDATAGAVIYYTTNGGVPTTSSTVYSGPIPVTGTTTIQAIALAPGGSTSPASQASYTIAVPASSPVITPGTGTYTSAQTVTLWDATSGATMYYTTDGSTPSPGSNAYTGPLTVSSTETIQAVALGSGGSLSSVTSAFLTVKLPATPPTFSPAAGTYTGTQTVSISDATPGAAIYYTTDGSTPTTSSNPYGGPLTVSSNETVQAVAISSSSSVSSASSASYVVAVAAATPTFSPAAGSYGLAQSVSISDTTSGVAIYYTTDGSTPTANSTPFTGPVSVPVTETLKAVAIVSGGSLSPTGSALYTITSIAPPIASPAGATYNTSISVTLSDTTPGVTIYYTADGSLPTASSTRYTAPFSETSSVNIRAIAIGSGGNSSTIPFTAYTIFPVAAATPVFPETGGKYSTLQSATITEATSGALVYYTTDGSTPTASSTLYTGPIAVATTETIRAVALTTGTGLAVVPSAIGSIYYYISPVAAAVPVFPETGGKYTTIQSAIITDATAGALIYYTTDGSTPTASSTLYTGPITVASTETIRAVAMTTGTGLPPVPSGIGSIYYYILLPTANLVISPAGGTYNSIQQVTITDATPGAIIYYTLDSTPPTTSSAQYSGPIPATTNTTIRAFAAAPNDSATASSTAVYSIVSSPPTLTPSSGSFVSAAVVTMTDATPAAVIYYTIDGSTPSPSSAVYTGPISVAPNQTSAVTVQAIVTAAGCLNSSITTAQFTVTMPAGILATATVSTTLANGTVSVTSGRTIPPNFLGLSMDWTTTSQILGSASTGGVNTNYQTLLSNLNQNSSAPLLLRILGDNSTLANIQPIVEPLKELALAVNVNYTLGVDMFKNNSAVAQSEAAAYVNGIPSSAITAIEIGNEPDNYWYNGARASNYAFPSYLPDFETWEASVNTGTGGGVPVMGPSYGGNGWTAATETAIAAGTIPNAIISEHYYVGGYGSGSPVPAADALLQPASSITGPNIYAPYVVAAHQAGRIFRIGEANSFWGGGAPGVSNSFSSALWSIDEMFEFLNRGVDGINWHSSNYAVYELYEFHPKTYNGVVTFNLAFVNPLYYGLLAFSQVSGNGAQLGTVATATTSNVKIWATVDQNSIAHVVVLNKDESATGNVKITLPGYSAGTVRYLKAANYSATNGVTLGGQTFDGSPDGTIQGQLATTILTPTNGVFTLPSMPITTGAIIDFTH